MANAFTLFGELKADTRSFRQSLLEADAILNKTQGSVTRLEQQSVSMGKTSATTARQFQKFNETIEQQRKRVQDAAEAYQKGDIGARRFASVITQTDGKVGSLNSRLKDMRARMVDAANASSRLSSGVRDIFGGTLLAGGVAGAAMAIKEFTTDSVKLFGTLDKLTRFTATLDKNFQSPENLRKFREDIMKLSTEIPHSAESIAKASFTIKSAFQDITEPELIEYLREFGNAATASNTDIASHAFNMAALAKQYKITREELPKFGALMASTFGKALATDSAVSAGFNRVLSSALSLKQPMEDLAAAMATLQSVSSDAENNTTLLLNVYSKLTDKKYIQGIQEMGVAVFDTAGKMRPLNDLVNDLANKLKGLSDQEVNDKLAWAKDAQAREGLKTLIRQVEDYNKALRDGGDEKAFEEKNKIMLGSLEARWEKFANKINNIKMATGAIIADLSEGNFADIGAHGRAGGFTVPSKAVADAAEKYAATWSQAAMKSLLGTHQAQISDALKALTVSATTAAQAPAGAGGRIVGSAIGVGMIQGIGSQSGGVIGTVVDLAMRAYQSAKGALGIQSPSKKFMQIGEDVAQGFINGITAMRASVHAAMADLVDVTKIKGLTKKDALGVGLIRDLIEEYNELNPLTARQALQAKIEAGAYGTLNKEMEKMAFRLRERIDALKELQERNEKLLQFRDNLSGSGIEFPDFSMFEAEGAGTGLFDALEEEMKAFEIEWDAFTQKMGEPPPIDTWANFWGGMRYHLEKFKEGLPSIKEALGVNLISSIEGIGSALGNAVAYWDGTIKGFFTSLGQNFRQVVQQIISELVRLAAMKLIMQLIGSFGGSIGGAAGNSTGSAVSGAIARGFASGGFTGEGSSREVAGIVHKKEFVMPWNAVKAWGLQNMEAIKNLQMPQAPQMAMAGGGAASTYDNSTSNVNHFHINVSGPSEASSRATANQVAHEVMRRMDALRRRDK